MAYRNFHHRRCRTESAIERPAVPESYHRRNKSESLFTISTEEKRVNSSTKSTIEIIQNYLHFASSKYSFDKIPLFEKISTNSITGIDLSNRLSALFFAIEYWYIHLEDVEIKLRSATGSEIINDIIRSELENPNKAKHVTFLSMLLAMGFTSDLKINSAVTTFIRRLDAELEAGFRTGYHACLLGGIQHFNQKINNFMVEHIDSYLSRPQYYYSAVAPLNSPDDEQDVISKEDITQDFFLIALKNNVGIDDIQLGIDKGYDLIFDLYKSLDA